MQSLAQKYNCTLLKTTLKCPPIDCLGKRMKIFMANSGSLTLNIKFYEYAK